MLRRLSVFSTGYERKDLQLCPPCYLYAQQSAGFLRAVLKDLQDSHLEDVEQLDLFDVC